MLLFCNSTGFGFRKGYKNLLPFHVAKVKKKNLLEEFRDRDRSPGRTPRMG